LRIVPPIRYQEPEIALRSRVLPVLSSVPVRLTTLAVWLNVPKAAVVKEPPQVTV